MKFLKLILASALVLAGAFAATAQGVGDDVYGPCRTVIIQSPTNTGTVVPASAVVTNNPVDLRTFSGIVKIDQTWTTNVAGGTCTNVFETSKDATNWVALTNYAISVGASLIFTNTPSANTATNSFLYPGTVTTPTAVSSGWATPYIAPAAFTNGGGIPLTTNGVYEIAFDVNDQMRFIHSYIQYGGTATNYSSAIILTGQSKR